MSANPPMRLARTYRQLTNDSCLTLIIPGWTNLISHINKYAIAFVKRNSHEGYLIRVVVMALAGEVARELSPIRSWSNNNYEI
jgi:hypothetical protein